MRHPGRHSPSFSLHMIDMSMNMDIMMIDCYYSQSGLLVNSTKQYHTHLAPTILTTTRDVPLWHLSEELKVLYMHRKGIQLSNRSVSVMQLAALDFPLLLSFQSSKTSAFSRGCSESTVVYG